jgi:zinc-ribbon domain
MYCPKCSTQNIDSARFCRACGANLSLVPQALTGRLPEAQPDKPDRRRNRRREPTLGRGITRMFMGMAFLLIAAGITFSGRGSNGSGLWLLIPAFIFLGRGIAELVTLLNAERSARQLAPPPVAQNTSALPPDRTFDHLAPPSITEGTTRHLDATQDRR